MKTPDPFYLSKRWEHLRARVMRRDGYKCRECIRFGKSREGTMVHHAIPREDFPELQWEPWNLVTLCNQCHDRMHLRVSNELSKAGIDLANRVLREAGKDIGYLRELEQRRTTEAGMV
jgi:predicted HNH restriction endonuclease